MIEQEKINKKLQNLINKKIQIHIDAHYDITTFGRGILKNYKSKRTFDDYIVEGMNFKIKFYSGFVKKITKNKIYVKAEEIRANWLLSKKV